MLHIAPLHVRGPQQGVTDEQDDEHRCCPSEHKTGELREGHVQVVRAMSSQDVCVFPLWLKKLNFYLKGIKEYNLQQAVKPATSTPRPVSMLKVTVAKH